MSDIESKINPKETTLAERVYFLNIGKIRAEKFGGALISGPGNNSSYMYMYSFSHNNRVVGYISDTGDMSILGSESVVFDKGVSADGNDVNSLQCYYRATNDNLAPPPSSYSTGNQFSDNVWRIGVLPPIGDDFIKPKKISDYNYIDSVYTNTRNIASTLKHGNVTDNAFSLTTDPKTTLTFYGPSEFETARTVFNTDIVTYTKACDSVIGLAADMYAHWLSAPTVWYTGYAPGLVGNEATRQYVCSNLIVTHDLKAAKKYIEDGTIPDDAIYDDPSNPPKGEVEGGDDDPNNNSDGNNGSDKKDDIPLNTPPETAATMSNCHIYSLAKSQLDAFISDMWDFSWTELTTNMMTGVYNNLIDNVQSIRLMPFSGSDLGTLSIVNGISCGWWTHTANVNKLSPDKSIKTAGTYELKKSFNGWADYSPYTSVELYLPYLGWMEIDTNLFMGHTIKVEYTLDVLCGIITYYISCDKTFIMTKSSKVACDIPISLTSGIDVFSDIAKNVGGAVSNVANARPIGLVSGSAQVTTPKLVGDATESGKLWMPTKCAIRITRPAYTRASNYASRYGYPCYGSYKLSELSGFTVIENYKSHYTKGIKKEEEDMIKSMMESGVYL